MKCLILATVLFAMILPAPPHALAAETFPARVLRVVDGDTVQVYGFWILLGLAVFWILLGLVIALLMKGGVNVYSMLLGLFVAFVGFVLSVASLEMMLDLIGRSIF